MSFSFFSVLIWVHFLFLDLFFEFFLVLHICQLPNNVLPMLGLFLFFWVGGGAAWTQGREPIVKWE